MTDTVKSIASLSPKKRELLLRQLKEKRGWVTPAPLVRQSRESNVFPLSFAQQRLWFLDQLLPGNTSYNLYTAARLVGPLHVAALEQSLNDCIQRHESLRTTFAERDGQPVQIVHPKRSLKLPIVDLQTLRETERLAEIYRRANQEAAQPFDLARGPLLRATLLRLGEEDHVLLLAMHHIVSDGWSMVVLRWEVTVAYSAFCNGVFSPLPELPLQYVDFAVWQRQWLQGPVLDEQLAYWTRKLSGLSVLQLPADRPRPAVQTFEGAQQRVVLSKSLAEALKAQGQPEGVTLFMTLLAAFKVLLYRYTGQTDISVGTPIANRNRAEIERLIGFFANTLVLRTDLSGNPSFREVLGHVRETALGAYTHQDLPFEKLVEALQPERDLSRNPLVQVMFALQNILTPALTSPELPALEVGRTTVRLDLEFHLWEGADGLTGYLAYNTDLFNAATIAHMAEHFQTLVQGLVDRPDRSIDEIPLLTASEQQQILVEWNATSRMVSPDRPFPDLFEAQVLRTPGAVAVTLGDEQLTYDDLNRRANQLAHRLQELGVGPEIRVGLCMERSVNMIVGLLGILKAGGAYVPLDPTYPKERLAFLLADSRLSVLVTQPELDASLPEPRASRLCLDAACTVLTGQSAANPVRGVAGDHLAYVIYTSGSTGRPKGVLIPHQGLTNLAFAQRQTFAVGPGDRILQFASLSFDASIFEIALALTTGATLCLATSDELQPGPGLVQLLDAQAITQVTLPPSVLAALPASPLPALQTLIAAGEACSADLSARWAPGRRFLNGYGPTEGTVWTSAAECVDGRQRPTIGRPIVNVQVYLLDAHQQPVPVGVPGEIYIGGDNLARGYGQQPELTAERFVPNPFHGKPGTRLYRTGDLARFRPNGQIDFLGRCDHQVKVRGFRIELEEIEAVLRTHAHVREAVVLAREDALRHKRLVAYVVPNSGPTLAVAEWRRFLQEKLPDYMIPAAFILLEALPLMPNGKVDRRALPAPDSARRDLEREFVAPRTPVEATLARIWADVLDLKPVGIHDNFFELGGDSILSIQIVARAHQANLQLTPKQIFQHQTIAELAPVATTNVEAAEPGLITGPVPLTPIQHGQPPEAGGYALSDFPLARLDPSTRDRWPAPDREIEDIYPLSPWQQEMFSHAESDPRSEAYFVQVSGPLEAISIAAFQSAWQQAVDRYTIFRTAFVREGCAGPQQVVSRHAHLAWEVQDWRGLTAAESRDRLESFLQTDRARGFDLSQAPLMRMALLRVAEHAYQWVWSFHHLLLDGWCAAHILKDVFAYYEAFCQGRAAQLETPRPYRDFIAWLQQQDLSKAEAFWRQVLAGYTEPVRWGMRADRCGSPNGEARYDEQKIKLPSRTTTALRALGRRHQLTLNTILQGAWALMLCCYSSKEDVVFGTVMSGRPPALAGVESMVGLFINVLPVRVQMAAGDSLLPWLKRLQGHLDDLRAYEYSPPARIRQWSEVPDGQPLFESIFRFQNLPVDRSLRASDAGSGAETARGFDRWPYPLSLVVIPGPELRLHLTYDSQRCAAGWVRRMLDHLEAVLERIAACPDRCLRDLLLSTEVELLRAGTEIRFAD